MNLGKKTFTLKNEFIKKYASQKPPFGFNGLGELVYIRTYSRLICPQTGTYDYKKENGKYISTISGLEMRNEKWHETVRRVVEGCYSMQKNHIKFYGLGWDEQKGQESAEEMYDHIWNMRFLPPGRGLWAMGTPITDKGLFAALNNCAFVSTKDLDKDLTKPFEFLMDMSMLGVGVGFDIKGAGKILIQEPKETSGSYNYTIPDTREGWVESVKLKLDAYFTGSPNPNFNYSKIRPEGEPIKTFGGTACGPSPLKTLHNQIDEVFVPLIGKPITGRAIVDIQNMIGVCVVAGNVRRTAEIVFGDHTDEDYLKLKDYRWDSEKSQYVGPEAKRSEWGWASNNSIFADLGMNYKKVAHQTGINGEPGYAWLQNMKDFGRMIEEPNYKDHRVEGGNPCLEQSLESYELCCLVETFPSKVDNFEQYKRVLKFAYLYAKTVTLGQTHWAETNRVMLRNRRIGTSMSGIVNGIDKFGIDEFKRFCNEGYEAIKNYDIIYSDWLAIKESIKKTSVKPSGTVSLLPGVLPGMHWPEDLFYIRRITISKFSPLVEFCKNKGYKVENSVTDSNSVKVEVPVKIEGNIRTVDEVSIWEQFSLASFLQHYWADNQVSCTVTFHPNLTPEEEKEYKYYQDTLKDRMILENQDLERYLYLNDKKAKAQADDIERCLEYFQYQLKGISCLPKIELGAYAQMPYEGISKEKYEERIKLIDNTLILDDISEESTPEKFCDGDSCSIDIPKESK